MTPRNTLRPAVAPQTKLTVGLAPYIWKHANLLHLPAGLLTEELTRIARELPLVVRAPVFAGNAPDLDAVSSALPSMDDAVAAQLALCPGLDGPFAATHAWCELLDRRGYLNGTMAEAASLFGVAGPAFEKNLRIVQDWVDPPGMFAADLADCLRIQLRRRGLEGSDADFLIERGKAMLEEGRTDDFLRAHAWPRERFDRALTVLRALDPNPGTAFAKNDAVVPEIAFLSDGDTVRCRVMAENLPSLALEEGAEAAWGTALVRESATLVRMLDERNRTLERIGRFLAEAQGDYLSKKIFAPRALGLREIARGTGLHISTVSRILGTRWARSDARGVLPLSNLLVRRVRSRAGESRMDYSYIESAIRSARASGLSDAELAKFLGIPRRTVAYHRQRLGVPPKRPRKSAS